ncbi:MAG: MFS transporter [Desulfovibrionaceae bacterium]|nr:MFS transporter [Desulfovibrionaceae bacterium]
MIAGDFGAGEPQGVFLVTATQAGYALGILMIVPLGDTIERRGLLTAVMLLTVLALLACASAASIHILAAALAFLGLVTVSGQIILPLSGDLAEAGTGGRIVGIVTSGITVGILFSRLLSGLVSELWGWRAIYLMAAVLNLAMAAVIRFRLPAVPARSRITYRQLIAAVFTSVKRYPAMRRILLKQGLIFGIAFNLFWNALTFLLSGAPFFYGTFQIGLVSLSGLTGAAAGVMLGKLQDRGLGNQGLAIFMAISFASMAGAAFSGNSIPAIVLAAALFSLAVQGVGILSQAQLFTLSDSERSRLNTAFVVSNFLFSAAGSFLASFLWSKGGWQAVTAGAAAASLLALAVHLCGMRQGRKRIF